MSMRRLFLLLMAAGAIVPISAGPSWACSCAALPPKEHARIADVVFAGRAVAVDEGPQIAVAHFLVTDVYKGPRSGGRIVETSAHGPACGFDFVEGRRYTVFALRDGGALHTNLCTATTAGDIHPQRFGLDAGVPLEPPAPPGPLVLDRERWPWVAVAGGALAAGFAALIAVRRTGALEH